MGRRKDTCGAFDAWLASSRCRSSLVRGTFQLVILSENQIADLTPLTKQTDLNLLLLQKNKITDLTPLVNWAKADSEGPRRFAPFLRLYLKDNPLSNDAKTKQIESLKKYGVRIEN